LWYQGEGNANDYSLYRSLQPELFSDWRQRWGSNQIPFLFVQLPNLKGANSWPDMREAQAYSLNYPNTGMAVTIDVGDPYDGHPHNKQAVGYRLALLAENVAYNRKVIANGPVYKSHKISGNLVHLQFKRSESKLVLKEGAISGFEVAGEDNQFYPAQASLKNGEIILSSARVSTPKIARYAWSASPEVSLYNDAGLPAAPFRTDQKKMKPCKRIIDINKL
jgi:sialate O-acetylesterase